MKKIDQCTTLKDYISMYDRLKKISRDLQVMSTDFQKGTFEYITLDQARMAIVSYMDALDSLKIKIDGVNFNE